MDALIMTHYAEAQAVTVFVVVGTHREGDAVLMVCADRLTAERHVEAIKAYERDNQLNMGTMDAWRAAHPAGQYYSAYEVEGHTLVGAEDTQLDLARYRWLRDDNAYTPEEWGVMGGPQLDELCDKCIAADKSLKRDKRR